MKRLIMPLPILVLLVIMASCSTKVKERVVYTEEVKTKAYIQDNKKAPFCEVSVRIDYLKNNDEDSPEKIINTTLIAESLGNAYTTYPIKEAVAKYVSEYISEYKNSIEPLYLEELNYNSLNGDISLSLNYELQVSTEINQQTTNLISFVESFYSFTGGAHGVYATKFLNFDAATGKLLELKDFFVEGYENKLTKAIYNAFKLAYFPDEGTSKDANLFNLEQTITPSDNFEFTEKGIRFSYSIYEIAPFAMGEPQVIVPYKSVKDILKLDNPIVKEFL